MTKSNYIIFLIFIIAFVVLILMVQQKAPECTPLFQGNKPTRILIEKNDTFKIPTFNENFKSKGEEYTCRALRDILEDDDIKINIRPSFLKNPKTGRALELDCYSEKFNIAVEYDGMQHRCYVPKFHSNSESFETQKYNDNLKDDLCRKNNIHLIRVPDTVDTYKQTPTGPKKAQFTSEERYIRIYSYLCHHLTTILKYGKLNDQPHYTTHYISTL